LVVPSSLALLILVGAVVVGLPLTTPITTGRTVGKVGYLILVGAVVVGLPLTTKPPLPVQLVTKMEVKLLL
jgi:hypothetical protein